MHSKSATVRKNRKIYTFRASWVLHEFLRHAKKNGVVVTAADVKAEIRNNPEFIDNNGAFSKNKFNSWLKRKNKKNALHSKTAKQLKTRLKARGLPTSGNKAALQSRLFIAEYEDYTKIELTIQSLEQKDINPPDAWQYAEVETSSMKFVERLNKDVEKVILETIEEVKEMVEDPGDPY